MKSVVYKLIIVILLGLIHFQCFSQTIIQMEEYGGVYRIPCKVNGAKMKLIFDTGADKVCLSLSMAEYLFDNDFISKNDIKGSGSSTVADGSIVDHIKINIKDIEIQGIHLKNIEAVVIDGQNAPLLLGQSAIKKLGKYSISGNRLIVGTSSEYSQHIADVIPLTEEEINKLFEEAENAYDNDMYYVALENYKRLYENDLLSPSKIMQYADCYYYTEQYEDALELYQSIITDIESKFKENKGGLLYRIGKCMNHLGNNDAALSYLERAKYFSEPFSYYQIRSVIYMAFVYFEIRDYFQARSMLDKYISMFLSQKALLATDCWTSPDLVSPDEAENLSDLYYIRSLAHESYCADSEKYTIIAAAYGSKEAIDFCKKYHLNYLTKPSKYSY